MAAALSEISATVSEEVPAAENAGSAISSAAKIVAAGEASPKPDAAPACACTVTGAGMAAALCEISATASEEDRDLMKADSSILDCSIMSFTLGENFTPEENSPASLLTSGPNAASCSGQNYECLNGDSLSSIIDEG
jgi:hypothetical protein